MLVLALLVDAAGPIVSAGAAVVALAELAVEAGAVEVPGYAPLAVPGPVLSALDAVGPVAGSGWRVVGIVGSVGAVGAAGLVAWHDCASKGAAAPRARQPHAAAKQVEIRSIRDPPWSSCSCLDPRRDADLRPMGCAAQVRCAPSAPAASRII